MVSANSSITSKGGGSGKRGLFAWVSLPFRYKEEGRPSSPPSRCSGTRGAGCRSRCRHCAARHMTDLRVSATGSNGEESAIAADSDITRRSISTGRGRGSFACSIQLGLVVSGESTSRVSSTAATLGITGVARGSLGPSRAASERCQMMADLLAPQFFHSPRKANQGGDRMSTSFVT